MEHGGGGDPFEVADQPAAQGPVPDHLHGHGMAGPGHSAHAAPGNQLDLPAAELVKAGREKYIAPLSIAEMF